MFHPPSIGPGRLYRPFHDPDTVDTIRPHLAAEPSITAKRYAG